MNLHLLKCRLFRLIQSSLTNIHQPSAAQHYFSLSVCINKGTDSSQQRRRKRGEQVKFRVDNGNIGELKIGTQHWCEEKMINVHNGAHSSICTHTHTHTHLCLSTYFPSFDPFISSSSLCSLTFLDLTEQLKCPRHLKHQDTFQLLVWVTRMFSRVLPQSPQRFARETEKERNPFSLPRHLSFYHCISPLTFQVAKCSHLSAVLPLSPSLCLFSSHGLILRLGQPLCVEGVKGCGVFWTLPLQNHPGTTAESWILSETTVRHSLSNWEKGLPLLMSSLWLCDGNLRHFAKCKAVSFKNFGPNCWPISIISDKYLFCPFIRVDFNCLFPVHPVFYFKATKFQFNRKP